MDPKFLVLFLIAFGCRGGFQSPVSSTSLAVPNSMSHYTGSLYEGNYLWSGAMNLCWTELSNTVIHDTIALKTDDAAALAMVDHFNHPVCTIKDLDELSYYIKAGFGSKTLNAINKESREKFPQKSFGDLKMDLADDDLISYAYFFKKVQYEMPFTRANVYFDSSWVKGFEAIKEQKKTVEVLHYESDDKFIIRLKLKTSGDELILAKGYETLDPLAIVNALDTIKNHQPGKLGDDDQFRMPLLKLSCRRDYPELTGKSFANNGFTEYAIGVMYENISFELDETGAKAESQAVIAAERGAMIKKSGRYFFLDKPFWVIMKRADSPNPYFLLGVNNTQLMQNI